MRTHVPEMIIPPLSGSLRGYTADALGDIRAGLVPVEMVESITLTQHEWAMHIRLLMPPPVPLELETEESPLDRAAYHDALTYLGNRELFLISECFPDIGNVQIDMAGWETVRAQSLRMLGKGAPAPKAPVLYREPVKTEPAELLFLVQHRKRASALAA